MRTIRITVRMADVFNKVARVRRRMLQDLGREPTPEELAVELDMSPEEIIEVQQYVREPISRPTPPGEVGKVYGVTREDIWQIESKTMSELRRRGHGIGDEEHGGTRLP